MRSKKDNYILAILLCEEDESTVGHAAKSSTNHGDGGLDTGAGGNEARGAGLSSAAGGGASARSARSARSSRAGGAGSSSAGSSRARRAGDATANTAGGGGGGDRDRDGAGAGATVDGAGGAIVAGDGTVGARSARSAGHDGVDGGGDSSACGNASSTSGSSANSLSDTLDVVGSGLILLEATGLDTGSEGNDGNGSELHFDGWMELKRMSQRMTAAMGSVSCLVWIWIVLEGSLEAQENAYLGRYGCDRTI